MKTGALLVDRGDHYPEEEVFFLRRTVTRRRKNYGDDLNSREIDKTVITFWVKNESSSWKNVECSKRKRRTKIGTGRIC